MMIEAPTRRPQPAEEPPLGATAPVRVPQPGNRTSQKNAPVPARAERAHEKLHAERTPSERVPTEPARERSHPPAEARERRQESTQKVWKKYELTGLEKVSRLQQQLVKRLEWMLPTVTSTGNVSSSVSERLKELLEEDVHLSTEYVHVVSPKNLRRYVGEPTFLGVLAPQPNKTRGLLEVELGLAHAALNMLLGGAGEAVALRPLTDIEEGVLTYVVLETLKALTPSLDPSLPKLRLEGVVSGFDEAVQLLGDEPNLAVVQLKAQFGPHSGYVRLFIPQTVLATANPPADAEVRRARRSADAEAHHSRLSGVKTWLRAEIGEVEISSVDLAQLRERDVVLVDRLSARPDKGEGGTATLKIGMGRTGYFEASVALDGGRFKATLGELKLGEEPQAVQEGEAPVSEGGEASPKLGEGPDESTNPGDAGAKMADENKNGAELLNDIPLSIAVEIGRVPITAEEVVSLKAGQVIDLGRVPGEPLDLSVNGKVVARGELVEIEGNLGVRVLSLNG